MAAVVDDLRNYRVSSDGAPLVVAGPWQPPRVHALAHAINVHLGGEGKTVRYIEPLAPELPGGETSLAELVDEMNDGEVKALVVLGVNPVYDAPAELEFALAMKNVPLKIHHGLYSDETSLACDWHVPALHFLESWGDLRAHDGAVSIQQPLIQPLYAGRSEYELLAAFLGEPGKPTRNIVQDYWKKQDRSQSFDDRWQAWLHDGVVPDTAAPDVEVSLDENALRGEIGSSSSAEALAAGTSETDAASLTLEIRPDPSLSAGAEANNGWLQELPKPFTKLTWTNAALLSPRKAEELDIANGDVVELQRGERKLKLPAWILPGQTDSVATVHLGGGRWRTGRVGEKRGREYRTVAHGKYDLVLACNAPQDRRQRSVGIDSTPFLAGWARLDSLRHIV